MNKKEILRELERLYNYLMQEPEQWAERENEKARELGYSDTIRPSDFYSRATGYVEGGLEYILKNCGVLEAEEMK